LKYKFFLFVINLSIFFCYQQQKFSLVTKNQNNLKIEFDLTNFVQDDTSLPIDLKKHSALIAIPDDNDYNITLNFLSNGFNELDSKSYVVKEYNMRGNKIVELILNSHLYKNIKKENNLFLKGNINIDFNENINIAVKKNKKTSNVFNKILSDVVINKTDDSERSQDYQQSSILYICHPDVQDNPYIQSLIDWRRQQGYDVTLVSTGVSEIANGGGSLRQRIKNYIENAYFNWDNPPEYLCIIGDATGPISVPTYEVDADSSQDVEAYGESDYPYSLIEGDDFFPEMIVGRISVQNNSQLQVVVNKILGYEKVYAGTEDWLSTATLVGDPYTASGISPVITNQYIEQIMNNYGLENVNTMYSGFNFDAFMRDQINSGTSYLNHRGIQGVSDFDNQDVDLLNNGYKLPFVTLITCNTGSFKDEDEEPALTEYLLRAGTLTTPKGAVAVVGASQAFTHTAFNNIIDMGIYDGIYNKGAHTAGLALVYGKLALIETYPDNPNNNLNLFTSWNNLMGDPLTHLWTNTPSSLVVEHNNEIPYTSNYFEVKVTDSTRRPVSDAIVTLDKYNDNTIVSYTDESGMAYFNLDFNSYGEVIVTSYCHNCIPVQTNLSIIQDVPNLELIQNSVVINDAIGSQESDGLINPGETIEISFDISNLSENEILNCSVQMDSNNSDVQFLNNIDIVEGIESNSIVKIDGIQFYVDSQVEDFNNLFYIHADLVCGSLVWNFAIPLNLNYGSISSFVELFSDQNDNSIFDIGETVDYKFRIINDGYTDLSGLIIDLNYEGDIIQVLDSQISIENLEVGSFYETYFSIIASNDAINGTILNIPVSVDSLDGLFQYNMVLQIQLGEKIESDPLGPDEYGYYIYDSNDTEYILHPEYDWIEINPELGGAGVELSIQDQGDNLDDSDFINLPFTFTFYGQDYDNITVSSNGWISFGQTDMVSFRNYHMPGPGGPSPMIAAFWDDLKLKNSFPGSNSNSGVYYFYDSNQDYLVIQWDDMITFREEETETFQIILYDSNESTPTGDDEIKIQYKVFNNTSVGYYPVGNDDGAPVHGQYSTIGIENQYGDIGLEYTYNNQYPEASTILNNQAALFISTRTPNANPNPSLSVSDTNLSIDVFPNDYSQYEITVENDGVPGSILDYSIDFSAFQGLSSSVDEFGYSWGYSQSNILIESEWIEITESAILLSFDDNDQANGLTDIGFSFPFYQNTYSQCLVNPNGWIGFGDDSDAWNNKELFGEDEVPLNAIFGFWDDLNPYSEDNNIGSGYIYIDSYADKFIVWYDNVVHWTSDNRIYNFQIVLNRDGSININYKNMIGDTDSASVGIINEDGDIGHQVIYNGDFIENNSSLFFRNKPSWININNDISNDATFSLAYDEYINHIISIDTSYLLEGTYYSSLIINPIGLFPFSIPITLNVSSDNTLYGDVNFDNDINISDIIYIINFIVGLNNLNESELFVADINRNYLVDIIDIILIVNIILSE
tara:strand:+ start:3752 stop:8185 length:4434 start_codon:yes stop_codon:yes gene_type:complete